ncbi:MAG TPA: enoyl-CoA hydratase-related protein [Acidimicrobiia bacterium]|jgi:enoyl-CoA hydratase
MSDDTDETAASDATEETPATDATAELLLLQQRLAGGVVVLTLNRPPMNPLSAGQLDAVRAAAESLQADRDVKAVVLTGSEKAFAAGADVKDFELTADGARRIAAGFRAAADALEAIERPVIAAIRGYALGGGLELALACDLRVAADNARLGQPEILLGIMPGGGGTARLARLVGPARAKQIVWTGRQVRADEALQLGIVDEVVPAADTLDRAIALAGELARGPVVAMGAAKRAIDGGLDLPLGEALDLEAECFARSFETADARAGVASFLEHGPGKATFTGS